MLSKVRRPERSVCDDALDGSFKPREGRQLQRVGSMVRAQDPLHVKVLAARRLARYRGLHLDRCCTRSGSFLRPSAPRISGMPARGWLAPRLLDRLCPLAGPRHGRDRVARAMGRVVALQRVRRLAPQLAAGEGQDTAVRGVPPVPEQAGHWTQPMERSTRGSLHGRYRARGKHVMGSAGIPLRRLLQPCAPL